MKVRFISILCLVLVTVFLSGCSATTPDGGQWAGQTKGMYLSGQGQFIGVIISFDVSPEGREIQNINIQVAGQVEESHNISGNVDVDRKGTFTFSEDSGANQYQFEGEFLDETSATINFSIRILNGKDIHLNQGVANVTWRGAE